MADQDISKEDRQLPASERRLQKAAQDGQVPRSRDVGHALLVGAAVAAFGMMGPAFAHGVVELLRSGLRFSPQQVLDPALMAPRLFDLSLAGVSSSLPTMAMLSASAALACLIPGGLVFAGKPVSMDFSRISPAKGLGRVFSKEAVVNLAKLLVIAMALTAAAWHFTGGNLQRFAALSDMSLPVAMDSGFGTLSSGLAIMAGVLLAVAFVDVPWQWFQHRSRLKMTRQEVRDEAKETDGDPHVKGRIRQRQREIGRARMLSAVPSADVVITNPTHYSVAIRYDEMRFGAPRVVAKGVDHLAARIREVATECGVTVVELPPLARALYAHVDIDHEVPAALYSAVAQVLAYVFQLRHFVPGRGRMPVAPRQVEMPAELDPLEVER